MWPALALLRRRTPRTAARLRAIDGNKRGEFGGGGQTHTEENTGKPWWEVDLGAELPIESVAIYNRTEGYLGKRLEGFTLLVLDKDRNELFRKAGIEVPATSTTIDVGGSDPATAARQSAMIALTYVRGREGKTFESLSRFVAKNGPAPRPSGHSIAFRAAIGPRSKPGRCCPS